MTSGSGCAQRKPLSRRKSCLERSFHTALRRPISGLIVVQSTDATSCGCITLARMNTPGYKRILVYMFLLLAALANGSALRARVTRVEITSRSDVLGGQPFGEVGSYERITGRVYFSVAVA